MSEPFTAEVAVRYADVDTYGHVNNAAYATFCEEARIAYLDHVLGEAGASIGGDTENDTMGIVVANMTLDFERPLARTRAIDVDVAVPRLGEKSFPFEYELHSTAGVHATGETTMVAYDRATREAVAIPDRWREPIAAFEDIPPTGDAA